MTIIIFPSLMLLMTILHSSVFLTTVNFHGWLFRALGALIPHCMICSISLSVTGFFVALGFIKDLAYNTFIVYDSLVNMWGMPESLAAILQAIVAISWAVFFIQIISRFPWGGTEG